MLVPADRAVGFFARFYRRVLSWANHKHAVTYLATLSFAESSFFPIPPDVVLIPMSVAQPQKASWFAGVTTFSSVLGGLLGYAIGFIAAEHVQTAIEWLGYDASYSRVMAWFQDYGFWIVFIAGFSPIPYKLFTLGAGVLGLALIPFLVASAIGRGARFFLVAKLVAAAGPRLLPQVERYIELIGWASVVVVLSGVGWLTLTH